MTFPDAFNAEFQARLEKMSALSGDKFDEAHVEDMKKIHDAPTARRSPRGPRKALTPT